MAGHSFQRCESRGRHSLLLLTAAGASCSRLTTPFFHPAARSLLPLLARSVPSVPGKCHLCPATEWQRRPGSSGGAGGRRAPLLPLPAGLGPGRGGRAFPEPAALTRPTPARSPRGLRVQGIACHVLGGRRQLRRQGCGGGGGGEEAAEALLRLPRDQEGAGRLVGTRPRAPRRARAFPFPRCVRPAPPGIPPAPPSQELVPLPACAGDLRSSPHPGRRVLEHLREEGECGEGEETVLKG